ncbi:MAG: rubrerythrin family protein [Alistipes sp.]|nr:rubrerythrin family protein [Alistipes sp.]
MKVRPILLLLLLAGLICAVGWLYYAVTRPAVEVHAEGNLEVISELERCCREKHSHAARYEHFAHRAEQEHEVQAATLFRALALSERVQERQMAEAITKLGGQYHPPQRILLFHGATRENLLHSLRVKQHEDTLSRSRIHRQMLRGNRLAGRALIWVAAADHRQAGLMERFLEHPTQRTAYLVCPHCGNLYDSERADPYCPHCLTDGQRFVQVRFVEVP